MLVCGNSETKISYWHNKIREMPHNFLSVVNAALILQIYCPAVFTFSKLAMETTEQYEKSV